MAGQERFKTSYAGVYYVMGKISDGKPEKIYFIRCRRDGRQVEEKAGLPG